MFSCVASQLPLWFEPEEPAHGARGHPDRQARPERGGGAPTEGAHDGAARPAGAVSINPSYLTPCRRSEY